ncbi:hypothetical protein [Flavisolibacter ginsengisoli]|uniref:hypothetical protein n=1 Tax=Flavisolibacter ginsengisoli TaxID=462367 RepID=UPI001C3171C7|nr:hypothetical protein [Flavisolibacter ginsengisoli]
MRTQTILLSMGSLIAWAIVATIGVLNYSWFTLFPVLYSSSFLCFTFRLQLFFYKGYLEPQFLSL